MKCNIVYKYIHIHGKEKQSKNFQKFLLNIVYLCNRLRLNLQTPVNMRIM